MGVGDVSPAAPVDSSTDKTDKQSEYVGYLSYLRSLPPPHPLKDKRNLLLGKGHSNNRFESSSQRRIPVKYKYLTKMYLMNGGTMLSANVCRVRGRGVDV